MTARQNLPLGSAIVQHRLRLQLAAGGGIPKRGIYDNMKTAVDKVGVGKRRIVNTRAAMVSHYLFDPEFCNVACGASRRTRLRAPD